MSKVIDEMNEQLAAFLLAQPCFFVATAPLSAEGHVNCSPRGPSSFRLVGHNQAAVLDLVGSGVETIAHVRENRRIVLMFCAFEGPPRIVRLHGLATVVEPQDAEFSGWRAHFPPADGVRAVISIDITRISDSCGYGVPRMKFLGERPQLERWIERKQADGKLEAYQRSKNQQSIDGLPGLRWTDEAPTPERPSLQKRQA